LGCGHRLVLVHVDGPRNRDLSSPEKAIDRLLALWLAGSKKVTLLCREG
jgi:hypothetical protein